MIKEKQPFLKRFFRSKAVIVFEVLLLIVISSALAREVVRRYQIQSEIRKLQEEVDSLEQEKVELDSLISYFKSDTFEEEQARLKLGLQKPGESVITILGESIEADQEVEEGTKLSYGDSTESNPQRWWNYFFSINKER